MEAEVDLVEDFVNKSGGMILRNDTIEELLKECISRNETSEDELDPEIFRQLNWWVGGALTCATAILGVVANVISIIVLSSRTMKSVFNDLLLLLCLADLLFLVTNLMASPLALFPKFQITEALMHFHRVSESLCHFSLACSVFFTISLTIERYQAVCYPHMYQARTVATGHTLLLLYYFIPSVLCSILFNIPRFIHFSPLGPRLQMSSSWYVVYLLSFQAFHPVTTTGIIPFITLSILNYKIFNQMIVTINRSNRAKDFLTAKIMMIIVLAFLVLNTPRLLIGLYEICHIQIVIDCYEAGLKYPKPFLQDIFDIFARYFMVLNSSINFFIYCMVGSKFRTTLFSLFRYSPRNRNSDQEMITQTTIINGSTDGRRSVQVLESHV